MLWVTLLIAVFLWLGLRQESLAGRHRVMLVATGAVLLIVFLRFPTLG